MKILHIGMKSFYTDGFNYQDNILPKYHVKLGYDVAYLTSSYHYEQSNIVRCEHEVEYINENGVKIIRIEEKKKNVNRFNFISFPKFYEIIAQENPDIIFIHNCQFVDISKVAQYAKMNPKVKIYIDNHADLANSAKTWISKNILHRIIWRSYVKKINPYVKKFYGVLPGRVDFLVDMYGLPREKCELLNMGADDENVHVAAQNIEKTKEKYGIQKEDILLVTGGKIDLAKKESLYLMDAVNQIENINVKLIVFGSVVDELKEQFQSKLSDKIKYMPWLNRQESYNLFAIADLVVFPGRHSVYWEQVAGQGIPMLVKYWENLIDIDCGGNIEYLYECSKNEIYEKLDSILGNNIKLQEMKKVAQDCTEQFYYSNIAKKSIEE